MTPSLGPVNDFDLVLASVASDLALTHQSARKARYLFGIKSLCVELKIPEIAETLENSYLFHF
jgi:hypothetical protein